MKNKIYKKLSGVLFLLFSIFLFSQEVKYLCNGKLYIGEVTTANSSTELLYLNPDGTVAKSQNTNKSYSQGLIQIPASSSVASGSILNYSTSTKELVQTTTITISQPADYLLIYTTYPKANTITSDLQAAALTHAWSFEVENSAGVVVSKTLVSNNFYLYSYPNFFMAEVSHNVVLTCQNIAAGTYRLKIYNQNRAYAYSHNTFVSYAPVAVYVNPFVRF